MPSTQPDDCDRIRAQNNGSALQDAYRLGTIEFGVIAFLREAAYGSGHLYS